MKKHLLIMWSLLLCFATGAWADEVTIDFSTKGYANATAVASVEQDGITITFDKGTNKNNAPKYYTDGTAVRAYAGNTFTVSSSNTITKIELTFASGGGSNAITADAGTFESPTWTGSTTSVMFTIGGTSGHRRIQKIVVTYNPPAGTPMAPTISGETPFVGSTKVTITNNEEGATIHYTTDGTDPTAASTAYSEPIELTETTTIKAIAVKDGVSSSVATATYTKLPLSTIAEAQDAKEGTMVAIEGVVVATAANGAVIKDDTDLIYYYNSNHALKVGQKIKMIGAVTIYGGARQFSNTATIIDEGTETVTYPTPTTMTKTEFDELASKTAVERKFVTYTGKLNISDNYYNITVGESAVKGSLVKPSADYSALNDKDVVVKGYQMYITGSTSKYVYTVATSVLELGSYEIKIVNTDGLTITPDVTTAKAGEKVYASYVLAEHYRLEFPDFVDDDGQPIEFTDGVTAGLEEVGGEMKMWFIMPEKNVTIKAKATKLYQLSVTQPENGTITVISVNMESDPYSKAEKDIHMMVTANEGYVIKSVEVKDANDAAVVVRAETGTHGEQAFNYVFTMPASNVKIGATIQQKEPEKEPEDININPETGADISQALATASEGKNVRNITINLNAGEYTMSAPIVAGGNIIIDGAEGAKINASAVSGPLFQYVAPAANHMAPAVRRAPATRVDGYTYIDEVSIKNVTITGIKGSLYWDGNVKVCIEKFAIENAVLGLATESSSLKDNTIVSFQGGSAKDFTVKNSTIYGNAVAKYFNKANNGSDFVRAGYTEANLTYENNTFYKVIKESDGQWGNNLRYNNNKAKIVATINNNIWVDCGDGLILRRMLNTYPFSDFKTGSAMANNLFQVNGKVVDQGNYGNGSDINGIVTFTDAPQGNFGGSVTLVAWDAEEPASLGDSRWTITYENPNVLWSSAEAVACNWASEIAIAADKLANLKVGDKIHVAVEGVTPGTDWSAQVAIYAGNGSGLEEGVPVGAGDKNDAVFTVTGDIKRLIQANGLSVTGNGFSSKKVTLEPAAEALGSDNSIFVGSYSQQLTLNKNHFINANDGAGIAAGDKLVVTCTAIDPAPGDVWFNLCDGNWTQIVDGAGITDTETGKEYVFTADVATTAMSSSLILNQQGYTITQVELIPAPVEHTYIVAGSNSDIFGTPWDSTNESNKMTNNGDGTYSKTYTVSEAVNGIQLKVVEDGMNWYGDAEGNNVVFDLSAAGSFTVNFDPATGIVTVTGDIVTGINTISADKAAENLENAEIYTLNGQRVEKPRKGLYIVNGKKVVIK